MKAETHVMILHTNRKFVTATPTSVTHARTDRQTTKNLNVLIKPTSFLPMLVLAIPTFISFFRNVFSLVHVPFFFVDMKYQNGLNHRRRMRPLFQYILMCGSQKSSRLKIRVGPMYYLGILACSCRVYLVEAQSEVTGK